MTIFNHYFFLIFGLCLLSTISIGQFTFETGTYPYNPALYEELDLNEDAYLQSQLVSRIVKNKKYARLMKQKRLAVGLVDLRNPADIRYASVNGYHMMYAASLPKIAVLLSAMESVYDQTLEYDDALKSDMRLMIAKSNNAATTRVIERMGLGKIAKVMQSSKYNLYDPNCGGGLWVGKKYAKADIRKPDPLFGISHGATAFQVCRFYTMLAYGKLVSQVYNEEMQRYLSKPEINHKFVNSLRSLVPELIMYRKSGSWRNFHSDSVLVDGEDGRRYILVALIEDPAGSKICRDLIKIAEGALGIHKDPAPIRLKRKNKKPVVERNTNSHN